MQCEESVELSLPQRGGSGALTGGGTVRSPSARGRRAGWLRCGGWLTASPAARRISRCTTGAAGVGARARDAQGAQRADAPGTWASTAAGTAAGARRFRGAREGGLLHPRSPPSLRHPRRRWGQTQHRLVILFTIQRYEGHYHYSRIRANRVAATNIAARHRLRTHTFD